MAKIMVRVTTDLYPYYPTLTELFEKMMYNRIKDYIDRDNLLYSSQYGFCKVYSTQHAILDIVNAIQTNCDESRSFLVWSLHRPQESF